MNARARLVSRTDVVLLVAIAAVLTSVAIAAIAPRGGSLDDRARAIEAQLRCPTCQGLSIADSPATSATQMRALVREQLTGGASDDEIRAFFVARYGRWILLDPPLAGPDLALWVAPIVMIGIGAALVVRRAQVHEPDPLRRRWAALPPGSASRRSTVLIGSAMTLALAVPIVAAVGPRLPGAEISGGTIPQGAPSIEDLEAFVRSEPQNVEALVALGDALLSANRPGEAGERYRAALELDPKNIPALLGVGAVLLEADRPDGAGFAFDRVLALSPNQPDALFYRAVARFRLAGAVTQDVRGDLQRFLVVTSADDARRPMAQGLLDGSGGPGTSSAGAGGGSPTP